MNQDEFKEDARDEFSAHRGWILTAVIVVVTIALGVFAWKAHASQVNIAPGDCVNVCAAQSGTTTAPITTPAPAPTPGVWNGTCPGFANTIVVNLNWAVTGRQTPGGMSQNDAMVVRFTTGNVGTSGWNLPHIAGGEWQGPPTSRTATLSDTPCDFTSASVLQAINGSPSVTFVFAIDPGSGFGFAPVLQRNKTYYVNIRNDADSCPNGCGMFIELQKPAGL